jgi:serine protease Do
MGVGFAIPSNMVRSVVDSILETGEVNRGQLGALISDLTPELAETFGYHSTKGVLVNDVLPKSPAEKAGLRAGDIVTHLNGRQMLRQHQLRSSIASSRPGTENSLTVFRGGDLKQVKVRLGKLKEE